MWSGRSQIPARSLLTLLDKCHRDELWMIRVGLLPATTTSDGKVNGEMLLKGHKPCYKMSKCWGPHVQLGDYPI